ncbi:hypothetical protein CLU79DRAFT_43272 [Phycomyces nitens]|nr:hypothetical protein CLU79DRAFT_43272 [Phycomyces nitens]
MKTLEWFLSTAWNLGLQCYEKGISYFGHRFILVAYKLSRLDGNRINSDRRQVCALMCAAAYVLSDFPKEDNVCEDLSGIASQLKHPKDGWGSIVRLFEIEAMVKHGCYEEATKAIEAYAHNSENASAGRICGRMTAVLVQAKCPVSNVMRALEALIGLFHARQKTEEVERCAKWTRLWLAISIEHDKPRTLEFLQKIVLYLNCQTYPQDELYYIVVVTWNEGRS